MKEAKEKNKNKFLKRMSVFLAGLLAGLGIGHNLNKALPSSNETTEKTPEEITDYILEEQNSFKENLKYEVQEPIKSERQILEEDLQKQLNNIKNDEALEKFIISDVKQRYIEEYNKEYNTNYNADEINLFYKAQSYSYVKDGKFYDKEYQENAKVYNDKFAYRIYNSSNDQLEAILDTGTKKAYSSENTNILGKYIKALDTLRNISHNPTEISKKLYKDGILSVYDMTNEQIQDKDRE